MKIKHLSYDKIDKFIYIGTHICCQKHFNMLLKMGIVADIDLEEEKMDRPSVAITAFLWLPVIDFTPPSQAQLHLGAHVINELVRHKQKCYVHCNQGSGRAPTLVAAYYIFKGLTVKEALAKIKKARHQANPNKKQIKSLKTFAKNISSHQE